MPLTEISAASANSQSLDEPRKNNTRQMLTCASVKLQQVRVKPQQHYLHEGLSMGGACLLKW